MPRSSAKSDYIHRVRKKKIERRDWYAVNGRRSQYKIDTEKLVETPEVNEIAFFFRQYLLGKPFFTPWGR